MIEILPAGPRTIVLEGATQVLTDAPDRAPVPAVDGGVHLLRRLPMHQPLDLMVLADALTAARSARRPARIHLVRSRLPVAVLHRQVESPTRAAPTGRRLAGCSVPEELSIAIRRVVRSPAAREVGPSVSVPTTARVRRGSHGRERRLVHEKA